MDTREVPGVVLEVGCSAGGTAALCSRMLRGAGSDKRYVCIDTFGGFTDETFRVDQGKGTPAGYRTMFSANSKSLVRSTVDGLGAPEIELLQADVTTLRPARIPAPVAAALIDVDLSVPVYEGLTRVYPLLSPGGVILVDDCPEGQHWKAREGYVRFMAEQGLPEAYEFGMGLVTRPA
nr:class I SAM-dependent methyltransferase [Motilibacter aurantiacus]